MFTFAAAAGDIFGRRSATAFTSRSWMSKYFGPFQSFCSSCAKRRRNLARGSSVRYTRWPKPENLNLRSMALSTNASTCSGEPISSSIFIVPSVAPPCSAPLSAPKAAVTAACMSASVAATMRAVKVDALRPCSAWRMKQVLRTSAARG